MISGQAVTQQNRFDTQETAAGARGSPQELQAAIASACGRVAPLWPLKHFVAVNPFLGFADLTFGETCASLKHIANADMLMPRDFYRAEPIVLLAWKSFQVEAGGGSGPRHRSDFPSRFRSDADRTVEDLLFGNVAAGMWACRYGIAIFENRTSHQAFRAVIIRDQLLNGLSQFRITRLENGCPLVCWFCSPSLSGAMSVA